MSDFVVGNLLLGASIALGASSHILIKSIVNATRHSPSLMAGLEAVWETGKLPYGLLAAVLLVGSFGCWIGCLTRLNMAYAYPMAALSILTVAVLSVLVLGESFSVRQSIGVVLMIAGAMLLAPTA